MRPQLSKQEFPTAADYGWCETDRPGKDATVIRDGIVDGVPWRSDYLIGGIEESISSYFFDTFRLPYPEAYSIYRGNSQDLLFLDRYGLLIRTGPLDVVDLINPFILQPLYWLPDEETDHVIALYPGVQLLDQYSLPYRDKQKMIERLRSNLEDTGHLALDIETQGNVGCVNGLPVVIDVENSFFGTRQDILREDKREIYQLFLKQGFAPHSAISQTMEVFYSDHPDFEEWMSTYRYHQPLRSQIWKALHYNDEEYGVRELSQFYQRCEAVTEKAERVISHEWSYHQNRQKRIWQKKEFPVYDMALYCPWTGVAQDNQIKRSKLFRKNSLRP